MVAISMKMGFSDESLLSKINLIINMKIYQRLCDYH